MEDRNEAVSQDEEIALRKQHVIVSISVTVKKGKEFTKAKSQLKKTKTKPEKA